MINHIIIFQIDRSPVPKPEAAFLLRALKHPARVALKRSAHRRRLPTDGLRLPLAVDGGTLGFDEALHSVKCKEIMQWNPHSV
jgi:hypothetical protein